jgi:ADP-ribose pyrophosphatase YjhB (NUDIX family)
MRAHRVYVNDSPLDFMTSADAAQFAAGPGTEIISESSVSMEELLKELSSGSTAQGIVCICDNPDSAWRRWVNLFTLSVAAGGVVRDVGNRILVIFRRGKWDLPKGKLDADESPGDAAVREVSEECGIGELELGALLHTTFHTYTEKKKRILKKTYWYAMVTKDTRKPVPQEDEDIEAAEWMTEEQVRSEFFANTYRSVREVLEKAL